MTSLELIVTDLLEALPGREEEVRQKLLAVTEGERRVGPNFGLIRFDLHRNTAKPSQFLLYEVWSSKDGFEEYHRAHRPPELSSFLEEAGRLLTEAPEDVSQQWAMISTPAENQASIAATAFLDALAISDADAIAGMWTDDACLEFPFAPGGFPKSVKGQPAIETYFRDALEVVTPIAYPNRVVTPLADPNACVIEFDSQLTVGDDPTVQENSYITIIRIRDGKIVLFKEHYDSVKRVAGFPSADEVSGDTVSAHTVSVSLRAREDAADDLAALMAEVRIRAAKDDGCRFYRVFRDQADPAQFVIFEAWDTKDAFAAHMAADWVAEVNGKIAQIAEGRITALSLVEI